RWRSRAWSAPPPRVPRRSSAAAPLLASLVEREDALPVVLHADDCPPLRRRLGGERVAEGADLGIGAVGVLAAVVVVVNQHHQPRRRAAAAGAAVSTVAAADARTGLRPLQHLPVTIGVAERGNRT